LEDMIIPQPEEYKLWSSSLRIFLHCPITIKELGYRGLVSRYTQAAHVTWIISTHNASNRTSHIYKTFSFHINS
jgi:hypothetical protein